ncbi:MAG: hypothetical protein Q8R82_19330 [Hyphomonadaceae bacterium]|nr:hypothetical protein [Hyphomonadaceae bacterium]
MDEPNALTGALFVVLVPLYAVGNRMFGDDRSFKGEKAVILGALAGAGAFLGFLQGGAEMAITASLFALAFLVWRCIPFFGGGQAPRKLSQLLASAGKHAAAIPPVLLLAHTRDLDLHRTGLAFLIFAAVCVVLSAMYGQKARAMDADVATLKITASEGNERLKVQYGLVELTMGAAYGSAAWASLT